MIRYTATVRGITWEGFEAEMDYSFNSQPTYADLKAKTGDFQHLKDIVVRKVTETYQVEDSSLKEE